MKYEASLWETPHLSLIKLNDEAKCVPISPADQRQPENTRDNVSQALIGTFGDHTIK